MSYIKQTDSEDTLVEQYGWTEAKLAGYCNDQCNEYGGQGIAAMIK